MSHDTLNSINPLPWISVEITPARKGEYQILTQRGDENYSENQISENSSVKFARWDERVWLDFADEIRWWRGIQFDPSLHLLGKSYFGKLDLHDCQNYVADRYVVTRLVMRQDEIAIDLISHSHKRVRMDSYVTVLAKRQVDGTYFASRISFPGGSIRDLKFEIFEPEDEQIIDVRLIELAGEFDEAVEFSGTLTLFGSK